MCRQKASSSRKDQQQVFLFDEPHSQPHRKEIPIQRPNQLYRRKYSEDFMKLGFTSKLINDEPRPQCVVCSEILENESLKAGKLQRHIKAEHPKLIDKPITFFHRLKKELLSEKKKMKAQSCKSGRAFRVGFGLNFDKNFGLISGLIRYLQINFQKTKLFCYLIFTLCRQLCVAQL